ncbi:Rhodanese-like protein, partial [Rickenella mellea]
ELSKIIKSEKKPNEDYVVVDVRGDDYPGGHIKGSVNSPAETFLDDVNDLIAKTKDVKTVIFHCALSQARGPKAARIYAETRDNLEKEGKDKEHEVLVLRGGFSEFQEKYRDDTELVEEYDKEIWDYRD